MPKKKLKIEVVSAMPTVKAKNGKAITEIKDPLLLQFLDIQKLRTHQTYAVYFRLLLEFDPTITGEKMLAEKEQWERGRLIEFRTWLEQVKGMSQNTSACAQGAVRGFFANSRKPLLLTRQEKKRLGERSNKSEDFSFDKTSLKMLWDMATLEQKWVLSNKSMGLRGNDFLKITWKDLRTVDLTQEAPIFFKVVQTEKERVPAYVFWDTDVIEVVKMLLGTHKDAKDEERVLTCREENLSYIMRSLAEKAHIQNGEKRIHFHTLRKFLYDRLVSVSSVDKSKMIVGKKVSSSDATYMNAENLRDIFKKAMCDLVFGNGNGAVKAKVEALSTTTEQLVNMLHEKDEQLKSQKEEMEGLKANFEDYKKKTLREIFDIKGMLGQRTTMSKEEVVEIFKTLIKTARKEGDKE